MAIALPIYRVFRPKINLLGFNSAVALWLTLAVNFQFYHDVSQLSSLSGLKNGLFITAVSGIVFGYYLLILHILSWRCLAKPLAIVLIVLSGLASYFVHELGIGINQNQLLNAMQTNPNEVLDLVSAQFLIWCSLTIALPCILVCWLRIRPAPLKQTLLHKLAVIGVALAGIVFLAFCYYGQLAPIFRQHRELRDNLSPYNGISSLMSYAKHHIHAAPKTLIQYGTDAHLNPAAATGKPRLMVLVVGETARAQSFSLNGYARNTNPELGKLDIINFNQATSCGTATAVSVPCMFSGMTRQTYDADLAEQREGLLDIAQRAGYNVTWIDNNSDCKRTCLRVHSANIPASSQQKWCKDGECDDAVLVESLAAQLQQLASQPNAKNQLLVLHQMGSHGPAYYKRSRTGFQPFQPSCDTNAIQNCTHEQLINSYDNTMVYTDHILASLIQQLQGNQQFDTALWYLSDHGESTGENGLYLHGTPYMFAPTQQTHIPMLMWFSPQWQQRTPKLAPCLNAQRGRVVSQDNLFPTLLALLDVQTGVSNPQLNLLNTCQSTH